MAAPTFVIDLGVARIESGSTKGRLSVVGFDIYYQALPEELVDFGRGDRAWIESLAILPVSIGLGSHERLPRPDRPRPDDAFWERVRATFRETPGLASRRFDVGLWDQLHWSLSAERRRGRFWIVDLVEPVPPGDLGTGAVRGEVVIPESVGVPDGPDSSQPCPVGSSDRGVARPRHPRRPPGRLAAGGHGDGGLPHLQGAQRGGPGGRVPLRLRARQRPDVVLPDRRRAPRSRARSRRLRPNRATRGRDVFATSTGDARGSVAVAEMDARDGSVESNRDVHEADVPQDSGRGATRSVDGKPVRFRRNAGE